MSKIKKYVIAVREKASVQIDKKNKEVKMHDYIYTFDEIIATSEKLNHILLTEKTIEEVIKEKE